jgi:hypothetical protein
MNKNTEQNYFLSLNKLKALKNEQCKKHHRVLNVEQVGLTGTIISHGGFPTHSQFDTEWNCEGCHPVVLVGLL